jgi:hypothetical protein
MAGAAVTDLTPKASMFLYGYPHVPRYSTGVHDPIQCSALYLTGGGGSALFLANDIATIEKRLAADVRRRIHEQAGVPENAIMISATHTHSGPVTAKGLSGGYDPVVPPPDTQYLQWAADRMVEAGCAAVKAAVPAEIGLTVAKAEGVGSNRHNPAGPADPEVPVLVARSAKDQKPIGCMVVYSMHPTVLHEDSKLISGDFIYFARELVKAKVLGPNCPIIYHNGTAGNQSPRHMTKGNTFAEAQRLGEKLGVTIADAIGKIAYSGQAAVRARQKLVDLKLRTFPSLPEAEKDLVAAKSRFERLKQTGPRQEARTAECDLFGAEETAELVRAAADGRMAKALPSCNPAEIQVIEVGKWKFISWPGEFYVEFGLALKKRSPDTYIVNYANGGTQGYIVTPEAVAGKFYEATNAVFSHENGPLVVEESVALLGAK